jgi:hypothetical protein
MPTPTIPAGNLFMDVLLWSGTGGSASATRALTGLNFQPDFTWQKNRASTQDHHLFDSVRGAGLSKTLASNSTGAEGAFGDTSFGYLSSFNANGVTTTNGSSTWDNWNKSGDTYVAWNWKAGGAAVTNTAGAISAQVSANTTSGFSVVTYTGNGSNSTVGHGLGVAPSMVIYKRRSATDSWIAYHASIGAANSLTLNNANAQSAGGGSFYWNSTAPTSSVFSTGTDSAVNASGSTYVAYCFAPIAGYSAFGSYTGNGSADGPFTYLGFRPRYLMWKRSDSTGDWIIFDSARDTYNYLDKQLIANSSSLEVVTGGGFVRIDFLSNGFKVRSTDSYINASGGTYIYMAFAENPFKYALAR